MKLIKVSKGPLKCIRLKVKLYWIQLPSYVITRKVVFYGLASKFESLSPILDIRGQCQLQM